MLEAVGIRKSFGAVEVLKGVDIKVRKGECACIIGPSGSGKSTFLRCLNRLEEPDSGSILLEGREVGGKAGDINALRRDVGMVFQSFNLYPHMTALGNVTLALRKVAGLSKDEAAVAGLAALQQVGLKHKADARPATLSGGQQQRVAIARAVALRPKVMLFDEPTSALDPELVGGVMDAMKELRASGMTMVVVTHELRFARQAADRVIFMADGVEIAQGPPIAIFDSPVQPRLAEFLRGIH